MPEMAEDIKPPSEDLDGLTLDGAFAKTKSQRSGLSTAEAVSRIQAFPKKAEKPVIVAFLEQFKSPILILLLIAACLSGGLGEVADAVIIVGIILASSVLSFYQEHQAGSAVKELLKLVETQFEVLRDGTSRLLTSDKIVPGDVVLLKAGSSIPGDGKVIESDGMLVDEAALTGESAPVEKSAGGTLYAGTHVQSGSGTLLVVYVGEATKFGAVAEHLRVERPEGQFHQGIRRYGYMLMQFTVALTLGVFAVNVWMHKPIIDSFLFSIALAVGLTPQLLPAIMSVTLARGAHKMAEQKVIVKRLEAIEDFGSMNVLCSDKTGTLTQGMMKVSKAYGRDGSESEEVLELAQLNALGTTGFDNPIDVALAESAPSELRTKHTVLGSIPYDFFRRRQSALFAGAVGHEEQAAATLVSKGSVDSILSVCNKDVDRAAVQRQFEALSNEGLRVLAVAYRVFAEVPTLSPDLEQEFVFAGLITFEDPLREDAPETVAQLAKVGVSLKLITGDNRHVAAHIAKKVGLRTEAVLTGDQFATLTLPALKVKVRQVDVFAEVDPVQKERVIQALRKAGYVVGYMGDGINDGPALHAADIGLSVSSAVDVAKEAADFVMLERGLGVIAAGVAEGRQIFANTLKYVFINTSAQFGNVFSMAAASFWLPFLPLLPKQILLNNFLTDIPAMSIAGDSVDPQIAEKPRKWDIKSVRKFMIVFGLHSSCFDLLTFAALMYWLRATPELFHTGWFIESAMSELLILLVIRTRKLFFKSLPGRALMVASTVCALIVLGIPYTPLAASLGFVKLPLQFLGVLSLILIAYASTGEMLKRWAFGKAYPL